MIDESSKENILDIIKHQHHFFKGGATRNLGFRMEALKILKQIILDNEKEIADALWKDLHKSYEEAYLTEISIVLQEIDLHLKQLQNWVKPKRVKTPLHLLPSRSEIRFEPLGVALIIAPWNYPFQLLMNPLVGAMSAGCCSVLKASPNAPHTAALVKRLVKEVLNDPYIVLFEGGREVNELLLQQRFDIIFFTGSPAVGKVVMKAAAEHLTPVVLELGGKSPCIVEKGANIDLAAKRIAWGKTINAGQTCIAPDYLFVHHSIKKELLKKIGENFVAMHGNDAQQSPYYPRIVSPEAMVRLQKLMDHGRVVFGGKVDMADKYIEPTIIDEVKPFHPIMQEEIFGPILPVMTFDNLGEAINHLRQHEDPLAVYYFGEDKGFENGADCILNETRSGGVCINDTLMHIANHHLPFGGVGNSGMGKYHGYNSFLAFSYSRAVVNSPTWIDLPFKYPPFKYFKLIRKYI